MTSRARTLTYKVWHAMHKRCTDPSYANFANYGARGIRVCDRWADYATFQADMGLQPAGMLLDRIDNDGPYAPENCRWVTPAESCRNTRRTKRVTFRGRTQCLADWAAEIGVSQQMLSARFKKGWSVEDALTVPVLRRPERVAA